MRSGDPSVNREDECYRWGFAEIRNRTFVQRIFSTRPALVARAPVNGHRAWKDYHGEPFDTNEFELVEGLWDHEHCSVCWFTITDGYSYWENEGRIQVLCDACHDAFARQV